MKLPCRKKKTEPEHIQIDPNMLKLIEDFTSLRINGSKTRSIGGITKKRQKRTREQVTRDWEVITQMRVAADRKDQHRDRLKPGAGGKRAL